MSHAFRESQSNLRAPCVTSGRWIRVFHLRSKLGSSRSETVQSLARKSVEEFDDIESTDLAEFANEIGEARVALLGEATHGTSEFYRMRARITRELIEKHGFNIVAVEADWPDARRLDHYVRHQDTPPRKWKTFSPFSTWMWRNQEVVDFVEWLRDHNEARPMEDRTGYNLFRVGRHHLKSVYHRLFRQQAFTTWNQVTCAC